MLTNNNPSMLVTINEWFNKGLITGSERIRLRKEALKVNVYTGKVKTDETLHTKSIDHKTFQ